MSNAPYCYAATVHFENPNAYKILNNLFNLNLKHNDDYVETEDYQLSMDHDSIYFNFRDLHFIRPFLDKVEMGLNGTPFEWNQYSVTIGNADDDNETFVPEPAASK